MSKTLGLFVSTALLLFPVNRLEAGKRARCCSERVAGGLSAPVFQYQRQPAAARRPLATCCRPVPACCVPRTASSAKSHEISLFDGKTLDGWNVTNFGGQGEVYVKDGRIVLEEGVDLTGISWQKKEILPRTNYEVTLQAMRVDGTDFFCGLTFPVKGDPCSLIIGGWGGGVCGLSSIDGMDASENETTTFREFKSGRWYRIKLVVTDQKIEAWIDKDQIVDQEIVGRKISIRAEVELSKPFGIASWQTTAALRDIRIRKIPNSPRKSPSPKKKSERENESS